MGIHKMKVFAPRCWTLSQCCPAVQQTPWVNSYHLLELFQYYSITSSQQQASCMPRPVWRQQIVGGKGNVAVYWEAFFKEHEEGRWGKPHPHPHSPKRLYLPCLCWDLHLQTQLHPWNNTVSPFKLLGCRLQHTGRSGGSLFSLSGRRSEAGRSCWI